MSTGLYELCQRFPGLAGAILATCPPLWPTGEEGDMSEG